jgi:hypothetical protein
MAEADLATQELDQPPEQVQAGHYLAVEWLEEPGFAAGKDLQED